MRSFNAHTWVLFFIFCVSIVQSFYDVRCYIQAWITIPHSSIPFMIGQDHLIALFFSIIFHNSSNLFIKLFLFFTLLILKLSGCILLILLKFLSFALQTLFS